MHLLVAVLNAPEKLDSILAGFVELGVRGATVINSEGMGRPLRWFTQDRTGAEYRPVSHSVRRRYADSAGPVVTSSSGCCTIFSARSTGRTARPGPHGELLKRRA